MGRCCFFKEMPVSGINISSLFQNAALFTAGNKDTSELYYELISFDAALAQKAFNYGINILCTTAAGVTLPRISNNLNYFECCSYDWKEWCWTGMHEEEIL